MATKYLKRRTERLLEAADAMDAAVHPSPTRPGAPAPWSPESEVLEGAELLELGREDSNLQLPKSRDQRAQHRSKRRKHLTDARDAEQAPAKRKIDPETVTKPSSGSATPSASGAPEGAGSHGGLAGSDPRATNAEA